jgi:hypothetical protein
MPKHNKDRSLIKHVFGEQMYEDVFDSVVHTKPIRKHAKKTPYRKHSPLMGDHHIGRRRHHRSRSHRSPSLGRRLHSPSLGMVGRRHRSPSLGRRSMGRIHSPSLGGHRSMVGRRHRSPSLGHRSMGRIHSPSLGGHRSMVGRRHRSPPSLGMSMSPSLRHRSMVGRRHRSPISPRHRSMGGHGLAHRSPHQRSMGGHALHKHRMGSMSRL